MTVNEAFQEALKYVSDDLILWDIWNGKEYDIDKYDLCIKPVLQAINSKVHNNRLFDSNSKDEKLKLIRGNVINTSKQRGQLVNIQKQKHAYIGQKL